MPRKHAVNGDEGYKTLRLQIKAALSGSAKLTKEGLEDVVFSCSSPSGSASPARRGRRYLKNALAGLIRDGDVVADGEFYKLVGHDYAAVKKAEIAARQERVVQLSVSSPASSTSSMRSAFSSLTHRSPEPVRHVSPEDWFAARQASYEASKRARRDAARQEAARAARFSASARRIADPEVSYSAVVAPGGN